MLKGRGTRLIFLFRTFFPFCFFLSLFPLNFPPGFFLLPEEGREKRIFILGIKSGEKTQKMFLQRNCEEKECREEAKLLLLQGRAPQSAAEDRGRQCVLFPETFLERGKRNHLRD